MSSGFDALMAHADPALVIVTVAADDEMAGCVVGFHSQCSIEPPRYAVWLSKANRTCRVALFAAQFAVHFLSDQDHDLAELFGGTSGDDVDKFARCDWERDPGGVPLLVQCPNRVVLQRVTQLDDGSDHVCLIGAPLRADATAELPALRVSRAQDITPGHGADDLGPRPTRPASDDAPPPTAGPHGDDAEVAAAGAGHAIDLENPESLS
ncbi:MAG: flavin reductase family protein [Ilumatobacteraceae bacterium]